MGRRPRLSLRGRLSLLTAVAVAVAVAVCAVGSWFLVRGQLYGELDRRLAVISGSLDGVSGRPVPGRPVPGRQPWEGRRRWELDAVLQRCAGEATSTQTRLRPPGPYEIMQVVGADGGRCTVPNAGALTVDTDDARGAGGELPWAVYNGTGVTADGDRVDVRVHTRAVTAPDGTRTAVSFAVGLSQVEEPLADLALALAVVTALGVLVSAGTGLVIARASLRPVDALTAITERIARTQDLGTPIPVDGADEIARLSRSFNTMTDALAASRDHQRQLIVDAGHELRTP